MRCGACNHVVCHGGRPCCLPSMVDDHVVCHPWWTTMLFAMLQSCCLSFVMVDDHVAIMLFAIHGERPCKVWRVQLCCLPSMVDDHVVRHVAIMLFVICHGGLSLSLSLSTHTHTHTHTHTAVPCVYVCVWAPNYFPPLFPLATLGFFDGVFAHNNIVIKKFGICGV